MVPYNDFMLNEILMKMERLWLFSFWVDDRNKLLLDIKDDEEHIDYFHRTQPDEFNDIIEKLDIPEHEATDRSTVINNEIIHQYNWKRINLSGQFKKWNTCHIEVRNINDNFSTLKNKLLDEFPTLVIIQVFGINDKWGKHPLTIYNIEK